MKKEEKLIYLPEEEVKEMIVLLKKYSFENLKKWHHYEDSLLVKGTDENLIEETYPQFERIKLIRLRKKRNNQENHDIFYELDDGRAIVFAVDMDNDPPSLINAFRFNRNLIKFIEYLKRQGSLV